MPEKKPVVGYVNKDLKEQFDQIADKLSISKSKFIENSIKEFVNTNKESLNQNDNSDER